MPHATCGTVAKGLGCPNRSGMADRRQRGILFAGHSSFGAPE
jgi:hypothetical protein